MTQAPHASPRPEPWRAGPPPPTPTAPARPQPFAWRPVAILVGVLLVLGAVLGLVWTAWSPTGPAGAFLKAGTQADETEAFVGADGRFAALTSIAGILVGVLAWYLRPQRGPVVAFALAVGGLGGSLLTLLVGHLVRGSGPDYACASDTGRCTQHLPLGVQSHGLLFLEAALAVFVYSLFVAFAVADDLGRPDPRHRSRPALVPAGAVGAAPGPPEWAPPSEWAPPPAAAAEPPPSYGGAPPPPSGSTPPPYGSAPPPV